jgi:imidazolonepropionase-like amidohydrolase
MRILPLIYMCVVALIPGPIEAQALTVTAARLLEVETGRVLNGQVIRIENGTISSVGPRAAGEPVDIDLGDVTLLPGLIDAHVHLAGGEELTPYEDLKQSAARAAIEGVANARKTLLAGFTTVRDLGSRDFADVALRDAIAAGTIPGPRMLVAVKSLSATGGHGDDNELPEDIHVERYKALADGPDAIRHKVRENVKYGADWIKLLATGGVMSAGTDPTMADYTEEEIHAAVVAAADKRRDVAVHAHGAEGIKRAIRAGARSIEHASMLDDEAVKLAREHGVWLVMNPYTNRYMLERGAAGGYEPYQLEKARQVLDLKMASLRKAVAAGLKLAYGTDAGVQVHGVNGRQFAMYVEAGMSPLAAIRSATVVNAELLRMEGRIGTLHPGAWADIIAVRGDPLADVRALETPAWIMKAGEVVTANAPAR